MSYIGNREIGQMYFGGTEIAEAYLGSTLVFSAYREPHYLTYGNVSVTGSICTIDSGSNSYIYTDEVFDPGDSAWTIQTRIKINTPIALRDIFASVDSGGTRHHSIVCQTNQNSSNQAYALFLSSNGTSWNLTTSNPSGVMTAGVWRRFQIVCTRSGNNYLYKMGYPDSGDWTSTISNQSHPLYGFHISFGGGWEGTGGDFDIDLSETKIWIDNDLWWSAL